MFIIRFIYIEAQQYGLAKAELLRSTSYDDVLSQNKTSVKISNVFTDEVVVGAETDCSDTVKQKVYTINVYKDGEILPRFSYKLSKLTTDKGSSNSVPAGTILPWYGEKANIPNGFVLCDGQNGTPDLRDRFLVGAGSTYSLGAKGGEATHKLVGAELPSQSVNLKGWLPIGFYRHFYDDRKNWNKGLGSTSAAEFGKGSNDSADFYVPVESHLNTNKWGKLYYTSIASALKLGSDQSHENRPPYYAVFYIMKL